MKTVNITVAGAVLADSRHKIPQLAQMTLDKFAGNRFKELKYVTKGFKYSFPFYEKLHRKRAFTKVFIVLEKALKRYIPYIETAKVKYIDIPRESADQINIRLGPYKQADLTEEQFKKQRVLHRYIRYIQFLSSKYQLPLSIRANPVPHTEPNGKGWTRTGGYAEAEDMRANTYEILMVSIAFNSALSETGYLLLLYAPQIFKVLETSHRLAHYADSTFRPNR